MISRTFRFDRETHTYSDDHGVVPHITGLLTVSGWADDKWFTEESSVRGTRVHELTAEYDWGGITLADYDGPYRGYLIAHDEAIRLVKPRFEHIEVPAVHPTIRFGGRCDRVGQVYKAGSVWEVKSGAVERAHLIQTALQAILAAPTLHLPAEAVHRYAEYVKPNGNVKLEQHKDRRDFDEAFRILRRYC